MNRLIAGLLLLVPAAALAHTGHGAAGFTAGLAHPLLGLDHLLAILGIGFWAASRAERGYFRTLAAAFGSVILAGFASTFVIGGSAWEPGLLASVAVVGALVLAGRRLGLAGGLALVSVFGVLHGHAHGAEMAAGASPIAFGVGFLVATAMLLGAAAGAARLTERVACQRRAERAVGGLLLAASVYLLVVV